MGDFDLPIIFNYQPLLEAMVSEIASHSGSLGALPLVTVLTLIWLHVEGAPRDKIVEHARYTFWYVLPTLPIFLLFPVMMVRWGF